jgi:hypothetical protein
MKVIMMRSRVFSEKVTKVQRMIINSNNFVLKKSDFYKEADEMKLVI